MRVYYKFNNSTTMQLKPENPDEFDELLDKLRGLERWGKCPHVQISPLTITSSNPLVNTAIISSSFFTKPKPGCQSSVRELLERNDVTLVDPAALKQKEPLLPKRLSVR